MGMMIIRHKVRDYGLWRPIFNDHAEMQKAAGLTNPRVHHSADSNKPSAWRPCFARAESCGVCGRSRWLLRRGRGLAELLLTPRPQSMPPTRGLEAPLIAHQRIFIRGLSAYPCFPPRAWLRLDCRPYQPSHQWPDPARESDCL